MKAVLKHEKKKTSNEARVQKVNISIPYTETDISSMHQGFIRKWVKTFHKSKMTKQLTHSCTKLQPPYVCATHLRTQPSLLISLKLGSIRNMFDGLNGMELMAKWWQKNPQTGRWATWNLLLTFTITASDSFTYKKNQVMLLQDNVTNFNIKTCRLTHIAKL